MLCTCVHCTVGWVGGELLFQRSYFQKIPESKIIKIKKVFLQIITQGKIGILNKNIFLFFLLYNKYNKFRLVLIAEKFFGGVSYWIPGLEFAHSLICLKLLIVMSDFERFAQIALDK